MTQSAEETLEPGTEIFVRALQARDPRFDGIFFVGITSTKIYCRPICPARVSHPEHRRFFATAAAAERAGYRPCRRCRPELAPGRSLVYAVPRLAEAAARRIAAGALNDRSVKELADELCVSERHLRRALRAAFGVSPVELAQTHRLLLAKRLLTDTTLPVSQVAYASGFRSLSRFNAVFRERYRMAPTDLRRNGAERPAPDGEMLRLTLSYRAPFAWDALLATLGRECVAGVEFVDGRRYGRTVSIDGHVGVVFVADAAADRRRSARSGASHVCVAISGSLVPVLMPLIARLRQLLDLDAEPAVIDECLSRGGLEALVAGKPGVRMPGSFDGFEAGLRVLLRGGLARPRGADPAAVVAQELGEPIVTGVPGLTRLAPSPDRVAEAGADRLIPLGVPPRKAHAAVALARAVAGGTVSLVPGSDVAATRRALAELPGVDDPLATLIVMRTLSWPDAFPAEDRTLQRAAGAPDTAALRARARAWRPWRAYAATRLWLGHTSFDPTN